MTSGARFFTNGLSKQLDNNRICPEMVLRVDMSTQDQFDIPTDQPGWNLRLYRWLIPDSILNRPYVIFHSIPDQGYEVYGNAFHIAYQSGQPFVPPVIYVFALDYVRYSNSSSGMRLWMDNAGQLVYDSGNFHLNMRKSGIVSVDASVGAASLNYPTGGMRSFDLGFPSNCAISELKGQIDGFWGARFNGYGEYHAQPLARRIGGSLQTKMFTISSERTFDNAYNRNSFDQTHVTNCDSIRVMAIDRFMYD